MLNIVPSNQFKKDLNSAPELTPIYFESFRQFPVKQETAFFICHSMTMTRKLPS